MKVVIDSRKKRGRPNAANQSEHAVNPSSTSLFSEDKATPRSKAGVQNRLTPAQLRELGDPMICLCLAIASAGRAMQRQSDNRHHLVVQVRVVVSMIMHFVSYFF